ncbi:MAG TPA: site-specific DNA-methyltransferase [Gemmatimonadales bacterium]
MSPKAETKKLSSQSAGTPEVIAAPGRSTRHLAVNADSRDLSWIPDQSVHLVLTSPPYWTLKEYNKHENQLGEIADYESFHDELTKVWSEAQRVLVPGGRLVCVVGDVCLSRKSFGRHVVMPLHADIVVRCRRLGLDNIAPIIWYKIANAAYEVERGGGGFLGKPYEPNAIIKNDIEFILMLRKPGGYRTPTDEQRLLSKLSKDEYQEWFRQIWTLNGASTRDHPAPYPLELAYRLVRMFSFVGDVVLDPFLGTGSTTLAAMKAGRNSVGVEVDPKYFKSIGRRLQDAAAEQLSLLDRGARPIVELAGPNRDVQRIARTFFLQK